MLKASGRSFYKASVPYPQVASSPPRHIKSRDMPVCDSDSGSVTGLSNRACSVGFASCLVSRLGCHIVWQLSAADFKHPCLKLGASTIVHPCTFMNALWALRPAKPLGVHFIRHPCLTRKMRVLPPAAPKIAPR